MQLTKQQLKKKKVVDAVGCWIFFLFLSFKWGGVGLKQNLQSIQRLEVFKQLQIDGSAHLAEIPSALPTWATKTEVAFPRPTPSLQQITTVWVLVNLKYERGVGLNIVQLDQLSNTTATVL